jgi:hypothetical protein
MSTVTIRDCQLSSTLIHPRLSGALFIQAIISFLPPPPPSSKVLFQTHRRLLFLPK